jgi:hypothetical protein
MADEMMGVRMLNEEMERDTHNMPSIEADIFWSGYRIRSVPGDGNCGIYSILQAFSPEEDYSHVERDSLQWQEAANLRQGLGLPDLAEMVTEMGGIRGQLGFDDLSSTVGHYFRVLGRRLVVINSTPDEGHPMYSYYGPGEEEEGHYGMHPADSFEEALGGADDNPIVLLYRVGHWDAVTPRAEDMPLHDDEEEEEEDRWKKKKSGGKEEEGEEEECEEKEG